MHFTKETPMKVKILMPLSQGHTWLSCTYGDIFTHRPLRIAICIITSNCDPAKPWPALKGSSLTRVRRSNHLGIDNKGALPLSLLSHLLRNRSCGSWISTTQWLPHLQGCKERERQGTRKPQGAFKACIPVVPLPTSGVGFIPWVQRNH